jgi:sulfur carrier protein
MGNNLAPAFCMVPRPRRPAVANLPSTMRVHLNGQERHLDPAPATIAELIRALELEGKRVAVEQNGAIVPRSRYAETALAAGDRLEIVGAVGGG